MKTDPAETQQYRRLRFIQLAHGDRLLPGYTSKTIPARVNSNENPHKFRKGMTSG